MNTKRTAPAIAGAGSNMLGEPSKMLRRLALDRHMHLVTITLDALGTILIGIAALSVHRRVLRDEKISGKVVAAMRVEQAIGVLGICMIAGSFIIKIIYNG